MRERERINNLMVRNLMVAETLTVGGVAMSGGSAPATTSTTTNPSVASVAGRTGAVVLSTSDVAGLGTAATRPATDFLGPTGDGSGLTNLSASALATGTVATARLGSGAASATTFLRGDGSWAAPAATSAPVQSVAGRVGSVVLSTADVSGLAAVATSGAYADLAGKPTIPAVVGGKATITGSGTIASGLTNITGVVVSIGQDASLNATRVTATWSGSNVTIKVTKPTSALDGTPTASTTATVINWIALGS